MTNRILAAVLLVSISSLSVASPAWASRGFGSGSAMAVGPYSEEGAFHGPQTPALSAIDMPKTLGPFSKRGLQGPGAWQRIQSGLYAFSNVTTSLFQVVYMVQMLKWMTSGFGWGNRTQPQVVVVDGSGNNVRRDAATVAAVDPGLEERKAKAGDKTKGSGDDR